MPATSRRSRVARTGRGRRFLGLLFLLGCEPVTPAPSLLNQPAAPAAVMGAIVAANVAWGDAYVRGDGVILASLYAEDARLMTDAGDVTGRSAITDWLLARRAALADSVQATGTTTDQLDVSGDRAYEAGSLKYTLVPRPGSGPGRELTVRYLTFWQRHPDGRWLIARSLRPVP